MLEHGFHVRRANLFNLDKHSVQGKIKILRIQQYPGFLVNFEEFTDLNQHLVATFNKSNRYKLKRYKNKLENCFNIKYKIFRGGMSWEEYDFVLVKFLIGQTSLQKQKNRKP